MTDFNNAIDNCLSHNQIGTVEFAGDVTELMAAIELRLRERHCEDCEYDFDYVETAEYLDIWVCEVDDEGEVSEDMIVRLYVTLI